jgi:solute:Na+ symporter, SSS family
MATVDYWIVGVYLGGLLVAGALLARAAGRSAEAYFLGGRKLPWWALGASGMSSNLDAAGTMTIISLLYAFGLHGFFIEMRGGVVLPIAVFLAFMGKWHQRSAVMTTAEWMELRFGKGTGGRLARILAAFTYLVITVGMIVFFLAAAGKFLSSFLPFDAATCALVMAGVALVYTMASGIYGVVWTDVVQAVLIGAAAVYVAVRGWGLVTPELLEAWPGDRWNQLLPVFRDADLGGYEWFGLFLLAWVGKGLLEGLGGSGGSAYMAQRFYAAPDETACRGLSMLWIVLFSFRWPMVLGFALIAIHLGVGKEDVETILPAVIGSDFFPAGVRGLVVAAILAASMSTFDSTINAGASYVVRDIIQPLFPGLGERALVLGSYLASGAIVLVALVPVFTVAHSILDIWVMIVIQLFPAFLVPFALRWYWARFNGAGFASGIITGFAASTILWAGRDVFALNEVLTLLAIGSVSLAGCLVGTLVTPPVSTPVLETFYARIRPWGWWPREWRAAHREEHRRDGIRLAVALVWQTLTFLLPMLLVLRHYGSAAIVASLWAALGIWLLATIRRP